MSLRVCNEKINPNCSLKRIQNKNRKVRKSEKKGKPEIDEVK